MKKILLVGDSIRMGYDQYVKMAFEGVAEVYYPDTNCRFASYIVRHLPDWKENLGCGDDVDVVYWNAGLWDGLIMVDGQHHTPIEIYKYYVERVCKTIKILFPNAKMVFATSTPVQEELFVRSVKRFNRDTEEYNAAAAEIVRSHGGDVDDLYTLAKNAPVSYHSDQTHYYTKAGTKMLTDHVVGCLESILGIQGKPLDYDALFAEVENVIGV